MDDENLSPFDTLPDSDLLSGQKGREHSPVSAPAVVHNSQCVLQISTLNLPRLAFEPVAQRVKGGGKDNLLTSASKRVCYAVYSLKKYNGINYIMYLFLLCSLAQAIAVSIPFPTRERRTI